MTTLQPHEAAAVEWFRRTIHHEKVADDVEKFLEDVARDYIRQFINNCVQMARAPKEPEWPVNTNTPSSAHTPDAPSSGTLR